MLKKPSALFAVVVALTVLGASAAVAPQALAQSEGPFEPTWESLEEHEMPAWYEDAKLGIFIHWGLYSVPGWAPRGEYAEWYARRIQTTPDGEPVNAAFHAYHQKTYGEDFEYEDFVPLWKAERWDPDRWAALFEEAGARYVVLTAEHHDGFPLWDSKYTTWDAADKGPQRDLVGALAEAVRARGMKFGLSYHAMLNYYTPGEGGPHPDYLSDAYVTYMNDKMKELIDTYRPDILWLDGDWKGSAETFRSKEMAAYYYNQAEEWGKEVVINDRLGKVRGMHGDFYTQEYDYDRIDQLVAHKWEDTRGLGQSFGYNRNERPGDYLSADALIDLFVNDVAKNANLLLDVGPKAEGTIPTTQKKRLRQLGGWLDAYGEGVYGTRPWVEAAGTAIAGGDSVEVRFTQKRGAVYAFLLDTPSQQDVTIPELYMQENATITLLGTDQTLNWRQRGTDTIITLPETMPNARAQALKITPEPWRLMRKGGGQ